jgi:hypothetical protein
MLTALSMSVVGAVFALLRLPVRAHTVLTRACCRLVLFGLNIKPFLLRSPGPLEALPQNVVVVANHESLLDVPALFSVLHGRDLRFVFKREFGWIPRGGIWPRTCWHPWGRRWPARWAPWPSGHSGPLRPADVSARGRRPSYSFVGAVIVPIGHAAAQ